MLMVLDASILLAWLFDDESSDLAEAAVGRALAEGGMAPSILLYEFSNGVRSAVRSRRLERDAVESVHQRVSALEIRIIDFGLQELGNSVTPLALAHDLTTYDASYLHLALRDGVPLATLDRRLRATAEKAGCALFV